MFDLEPKDKKIKIEDHWKLFLASFNFLLIKHASRNFLVYYNVAGKFY
jgi:hypothetical protein